MCTKGLRTFLGNVDVCSIEIEAQDMFKATSGNLIGFVECFGGAQLIDGVEYFLFFERGEESGANVETMVLTGENIAQRRDRVGLGQQRDDEGEAKWTSAYFVGEGLWFGDRSLGRCRFAGG